MLETGTKAPAFELPDQNGVMHRLEDYKGKKVILYFYPKDNTPGCTKQACGYSELYKSIIGTGRVREVPEPEKLEAMEAVVAHYTDAKPPIDPAMLERVRLFALDVDELSCKEHV